MNALNSIFALKKKDPAKLSILTELYLYIYKTFSGDIMHSFIYHLCNITRKIASTNLKTSYKPLKFVQCVVLGAGADPHRPHCGKAKERRRERWRQKHGQTQGAQVNLEKRSCKLSQILLFHEI